MSKSHQDLHGKTLFIVRETRFPGLTTTEHLFIKLTVENESVGYYENISSQCFRYVKFDPATVEKITPYKGEAPIRIHGQDFYPDYITELIIELAR